MIKIHRLVKLIFNENDLGNLFACAVAAVGGGLAWYLYEDFVISACTAIFGLTLTKILASTIYAHFRRLQKHRKNKKRVKDLFESLGREERATVEAFVYSGGSVMTWKETNDSPKASVAGIESLIHRGLIEPSVTFDGMRDTFVLDTELFNYARKVLPEFPF